MKKKRLISTAIAGTLAAAIIVGGGTFAYLKAQTDQATVNKFNANSLTVEIEESGNRQYEIIPGATDTKDPKVTGKTSVDTYVFVKVKNTLNGQVSYDVDTTNWTEVTGATGLGTDEKLYSHKIKVTTKGTEENYSFNVLKDNQVSYPISLETTTDGTLEFTAYAVQALNDNNVEFEDAAAAYNAAFGN